MENENEENPPTGSDRELPPIEAVLLLDVPVQHDLPGVDTRATRVRDWLQGLPFADAVGTAEAAVQRLEDLNDQFMPGTKRLELLQHFTTAFARLYSGQEQALDQLGQANQLTTHLNELGRQLNYGYRYAFNDLVQHSSGWRHKKRLAQAAHYAGLYTVLCLVGQLQQYQPAPASAWSDLVQLVGFCRAHTLQPAPGTAELSNETCNVEELFMAAALVRLADPYRLEPGTGLPLFRYLLQHGSLSRLLPAAPEAGAGVFYIAEDGTPHHAHTERNWDPRWYLDARALIEQAHRDLDLVQHDHRSGTMGFGENLAEHEVRTLLARVLRAWQRQGQRASVRAPGSGPVELALGFNATWQALNQGTPFLPERFGDGESDEEINISSSFGALQVADAVDYPTQVATVQNHSSGGVALRFPATLDKQVKPGQLIALLPPRGEDAWPTQNWLLGIIRWRSSREKDASDEGEEILAGIQYLARKAVPLAAATDSGRVRPAISADVKYRGQRLHTLLLPKGLYGENSHLTLLRDGLRQGVTTTKLLESGSGFERVLYSGASE